MNLVAITSAPSAERPTWSPSELVAALRRGEPKAAALVWDRCAPLVRRVLRRVMGPRAQVEDEVQETFMLLFEKLPSLRDPNALESFVYGISLNVARRELQRRRRWWLPGAEGDLERSRSPQHDLNEVRPALNALYDILDNLGPDLRLAFVLRYVEGLEVTETATALGVSLATAKRRIRKSRDIVWARSKAEPRLQGQLQFASEEPRS